MHLNVHGLDFKVQKNWCALRGFGFKVQGLGSKIIAMNFLQYGLGLRF